MTCGDETEAFLNICNSPLFLNQTGHGGDHDTSTIQKMRRRSRDPATQKMGAKQTKKIKMHPRGSRMTQRVTKMLMKPVKPVMTML